MKLIQYFIFDLWVFFRNATEMLFVIVSQVLKFYQDKVPLMVVLWVKLAMIPVNQVRVE